MRIAAAVGLGLAAMLVVGCTSSVDPISAGGSAPAEGSVGSPSSSPTPALSLAPVASPVLDAVTATRALGSAAVTVRNTSSIGSLEPWTSIGEGSVDLGKGLGRIAFESSNGGTSTLLLNQDGAFVSPDGGTTWFLLGFDETTPLMGSIDALRGLDRIEWSDAQADTVDGVALTRYDGVMVDATIADAVDGMGVSTERPELLAQVDRLEIDVSLWVDEAGRIVRVLRSVDGTTPEGPLQATQLVTLGRFREAIDLASPPEDRVQPAPEG